MIRTKKSLRKTQRKEKINQHDENAASTKIPTAHELLTDTRTQSAHTNKGKYNVNA